MCINLWFWHILLSGMLEFLDKFCFHLVLPQKNWFLRKPRWCRHLSTHPEITNLTLVHKYLYIPKPSLLIAYLSFSEHVGPHLSWWFINYLICLFRGDVYMEVGRYVWIDKAPQDCLNLLLNEQILGVIVVHILKRE